MFCSFRESSRFDVISLDGDLAADGDLVVRATQQALPNSKGSQFDRGGHSLGNRHLYSQQPTSADIRDAESSFRGEIPQVDAIVVLGGGSGRAYPPQPVVHLGAGGDRLVYATALYKEGRAPLVVFSGNRFESAEMEEVMEMMGVPRTAMLEQDAPLQNTYGAARDLKPALISHNVRRVLVVTSAIRMPRALAVFRRLGISAVPAPTDFITRTDPAKQPADSAAAVLPNMGSLGVSTAAIHEFLGLVV